jgi:hypothetical protein
VVDLSSELVEKDLQVERLSQRIATLEQQVEILEMEANEAGSEGEEAPEELGPAPGAHGTTSTMPPSLVFSVASTAQG